MRGTRCVAVMVIGICVFTLGSDVVWGQSSAQTKSLVNVDAHGVGAHGSSRLFHSGKSDRRRSAVAEHLWRRDLLLSVESRSGRIRADPCKVRTAIRRLLRMAMTMGKLEDVDPTYF